MRIEVKLIGFLSYKGFQGGFKGGVVYLQNDSLVSNLLDEIGISASEPYLIVRNQQLLAVNDKLFDGDTIQFIPPISGG